MSLKLRREVRVRNKDLGGAIWVWMALNSQHEWAGMEWIVVETELLRTEAQSTPVLEVQLTRNLQRRLMGAIRSRKKEQGRVMSWRPGEENSSGSSDWTVQLTTVERSHEMRTEKGPFLLAKWKLLWTFSFSGPVGTESRWNELGGGWEIREWSSKYRLWGSNLNLWLLVELAGTSRVWALCGAGRRCWRKGWESLLWLLSLCKAYVGIPGDRWGDFETPGRYNSILTPDPVIYSLKLVKEEPFFAKCSWEGLWMSAAFPCRGILGFMWGSPSPGWSSSCPHLSELKVWPLSPFFVREKILPWKFVKDWWRKAEQLLPLWNNLWALSSSFPTFLALVSLG